MVAQDEPRVAGRKLGEHREQPGVRARGVRSVQDEVGVLEDAVEGERGLEVALDHAAARLDASAVEHALVTALRARYPQEAGVTPGKAQAWDRDYADAMATVYHDFPDDPDVAALYVDAIMTLTPWNLWDLRTGEPAAGARTTTARVVLESSLDRHAHHPGLLHLYIHLMEMSPRPELALASAERLRGLVPDAGHLQHMPSHIYVLVGDYRSAIDSNRQATLADERFFAYHRELDFYTLYRIHNYHFLIYSALFMGSFSTAMEALLGVERVVTEELLRIKSPPMADWLEAFMTMRAHVLVRFGHWSDIINGGLPLPADADLYCVTTAMAHYARGVAFAAMGRVADAEHERALFERAAARVPASRTLFNNR